MIMVGEKYSVQLLYLLSEGVVKYLMSENVSWLFKDKQINTISK